VSTRWLRATIQNGMRRGSAVMYLEGEGQGLEFPNGTKNSRQS